MKQALVRSTGLLALCVAPLAAKQGTTRITTQAMDMHVCFLSSDLLDGCHPAPR